MKSEIMKRHSISKATVYREMKKDTPGLYKRPAYNPPERPVTERERRMVEELLINQYKVQDIVLIMERETGESYSWDRINRIRDVIEDLRLKIEDEKRDEENRPPRPASTIGAIGGPPLLSKEGSLSDAIPPAKDGIVDLPKGNETVFGQNIKAVIYEILGWDRIAEGSFFMLNICGVDYTLSREVVSDILLVIANYIDAGENTLTDINRLRLTHITNEKIRQLSLGAYISVKELKELVHMSRMLAEAERTDNEPLSMRDLVILRDKQEAKEKSKAAFYEAVDKGEPVTEDDEEDDYDNPYRWNM